MRVVQEFYCNDCNGFFRATLNIALNINIELECPNCKRRHPRQLKDGVITEGYGGHYTDVIVVMPSTYSKNRALLASIPHMRNGVVVHDPSRDLITDRWNELYGDRI